MSVEDLSDLAAALTARWGEAPKRFVAGTHRTTAPSETLSRVEALCPALGITRIADVTGLDHIGIPVVMVCRPNSRSLAVSQGKGPTMAAARASGLMESVESWHAERVLKPLLWASTDELRYSHRLFDLDVLPRPAGSRYHPARPQLWVEGDRLTSGEGCWLPLETVHLDFRVPGVPGDGAFFNSSSGLASGNVSLEAIAHATCELIERDASTTHRLRPEAHRRARRVDLSTVTDPFCRDILGRYERAGVAVGVWETTTDVGVAAFDCLIIDRDENPMRPLAACFGAGCHPAPQVALLRALTEAAQSRLTAIAGSRDDEGRRDYARLRAGPTRQRLRALICDEQHAQRAFSLAPAFESDDFALDVAWLLKRLHAAGIEEVVAVDLHKPALGVAVVKVVAGGLEPPYEINGYRPGPRALAASEGR
ncbi:MAG: YcaO-like protein with predicted kinase domain [Myxococcota bacterium]